MDHPLRRKLENAVYPRIQDQAVFFLATFIFWLKWSRSPKAKPCVARETADGREEPRAGVKCIELLIELQACAALEENLLG
jgi:hypothetical protein